MCVTYRQKKENLQGSKIFVEVQRVYPFDTSKADKIFDHMLIAKVMNIDTDPLPQQIRIAVATITLKEVKDQEQGHTKRTIKQSNL